MDGFLAAGTERRRTLKAPIGCVGIGLHSGRRVSLTLRPAVAGAGVTFRRTDLGVDLPARFDLVSDTRLCTALALPDQPHVRIGTIEHVMAALAACGIDDAVVEVDGPEVPILDGSAAPFIFLIDCAGIATTAMPRATIEVLKPVRVQDGEGPGAAWVALYPTETPGFEAALEIDFPSPVIGHQSLSLRVTESAFRAGLASARTFTMAEDVARLRAAGLALGGSLDNAVVVDGPLVLNPGGLRSDDECVRHKLLDVVGDLALAGAPLSARFAGSRSGHALNNRLLRALFADASAWRWRDAGFAATPAGQSVPQGVLEPVAA
ncbi:UDP-3-O-acyl-N-acetylglucosamine deacetylase [Roseomonas sp. M0104]|uniref:UDP-3-O-acyl-N-acetylglucosamine deacetylase n=1 Tax=Teichococcus coralli TaxID=2545983 RepID=A0A845B876_9PROT|nr:UDP-3-O-acyl-N-acetylglucosamine deacetylase [Pseudoroseomonas coralli]MXP62728.1 UDP-3-O-acyl-N-acetylglucosamine deacetylase [Pseudoroseomonas coralli]